MCGGQKTTNYKREALAPVCPARSGAQGTLPGGQVIRPGIRGMPSNDTQQGGAYQHCPRPAIRGREVCAPDMPGHVCTPVVGAVSNLASDHREASAPECLGDTQQCQQGSAKHLVADYETLRCAQGDILLLFSLVKLHHRADERCRCPCAR